MFLRCNHCRGAATAGLMHLHGQPYHLCRTCAEPYIKRNRMQAGKIVNVRKALSKITVRLAKAS